MFNKFVFYDTETTGIHKDFSQIIQCGSILTDSNLTNLDEQNIGSSPLPWIIPQPRAMLTNKKIPFISENQNIKNSLKTLNQKNLGVLIARNKRNQTTGIFTDGDIKRAIQKKIDRTVINLEDDPGTTGSTILDVLERTPGVIVDRQNESISMLGKGGVNVMINGKLTYMPSS